MKRFEFIAGLLLLCGAAMLSSCIKDDVDSLNDLNDLNREFRFAATQSQGDNGDYFTRSAAADEQADEQAEEAPQMAIYDVEGDEELEKPLYLHMTSEKRPAPTAEEVCADETITRGAPVTSESKFINMHQKRGFGLFTYVYKPGTWNASATTSEYMHNIPITYWSSAKYWAANSPTGKTQYHWPGENYKVRFYAYAPAIGVFYDHEESADKPMTIQKTAFSGTPKITYCVTEYNTFVETADNSASTAENLPTHADLLYAKSAEYAGNHNKTVNLSFKHALTAVSFNIGAGMVPGTIKSIVFQNVYREGVLNLDKTTNAWSGLTTKGTVKLVKDIAIKGTEGENILPEEYYFMMMPQTLPSDATCTITFVDNNGKSHTLTGAISGQKWNMGYHYIYTLSPAMETNYEFKVTTSMSKTDNQYKLEDDYLGGETTSWTITSYKTVSNSLGVATQEAVGWKAQAYINNKWVDITTKPNIFSKFTNSGTGSVTAQTFNAEMATIVPDDPWNPFGQPAERDAELAGVVDLYNDVCGGSTANCYVVNRAGTYSFPLFYGNAMKGHQANPSAYNGNAFVDYNGASVVNPNISIPSTACAKLLWCDAPQLVTDVELSANTVNYDGYSVRTIKFRVPRENITPGNAVIALYNKDGGTIIWSWHIWVTTWNPNITPNTEVPEVKNSDGSTRIAARKHSIAVTSYNKTFYFATEILGYCPSRKATWNKRDIKIRFVQVDNGVEIEGKVSAEYYFNQTSNSINQQYGEGNMPYYQWGRKDPLLPYHYLTNASGISIVGEEKFCYAADFTKFSFGIVKIFGTLRTNNVLTGKSINESIRNPHVFYSRYRNSPATMNDGSEYDWCNDDFPAQYSRWDSGNTSYTSANDVKTQKTIYDPCPVGWCVPPAGAWRGILDDGGATGGHYITETATYYPNDKTKSYSISGLVTPITGDRNRYLGTPWVDTKNERPCEFWTSGINVGTGADGVDYSGCGYMVKSYGTSYTLGLLGMSSGFAVLPVKEH